MVLTLSRVQINIKGPALTVRAFIPTKGPEPIILGTSTMAVALPPAMLPRYSSYVVSKLATIKLNELLQEEHPDVRFVTVHPGVVETDMFTKSEMAGLPIDQSEYSLWEST
jgi:NAD(P)-dependent dehydrogenase (short-subunit alcohol dehydrogenase family)